MKKHRTGRPARVLSVAACLFLLSGCSITSLQHDVLEEPAELRSGAVNVAPKATGLDGGKVGWGRITLFSIPVAPIYIQSDEAADMMDVISSALSVAGYSPNYAESADGAPLLRADVTRARFNNYTWFAPLVPTWGNVDVTLQLLSSGGEILWEESLHGGRHTFNFTDGYNIAATRTMTELANNMVAAFTSQAFSDAVNLPE